MFQVTVKIDGRATGTYPLAEGANIVGRAREAQILVELPAVSRSHVRLMVRDNRVTAENLSQFGAQLQGAPLTGPAPFELGQALQIGRHVSISLERAPGGEPETGDRVPAGEPAGEVTRAAAVPAARPPAAPTRPPPPDATSAHVTGSGPFTATRSAVDGPFTTPGPASLPESGDDEAGKTHAMHTRAASPEEIEFLREQARKRPRRHLLTGLVVAAALLVPILVFYPRQPPPETELGWPKDAKGEYLDAFVPAPSGGHRDGGYDLAFPGAPGWESTPSEGGLAVTCRVGRDRDVTLRLQLTEETDARFLDMDREEALRDWMAGMTAQGGHWNFDRPGTEVGFFGKEHGIPFLRVSYERENKGARFGFASMFRHGRRRVVLLAEVPAVERTRAESIAGSKFIYPSTTFEHAWWEGRKAPVQNSELDLREDAQREMRRVAPATWSELERTLMNGLLQAARHGNTAVETELHGLLVDLRAKQAHWFNGQQLAKDNAEAAGTESQRRQVVEYSKAVFSSPEDQRYFTVRKW